MGTLSPNQYRTFFESTKKTWLFHFTGGEPFLFPNFIELCRILTRDHYISINSNLSLPNSLQLIDRVNAEAVDYIHCGVHLEDRTKHEGLSTLLQRLKMFADSGFAIFASLVMTPDAFGHFEQLNHSFQQIGVPLIPKALRGVFRQQHFPTNYTPEQVDKFIAYSENAARELAENKSSAFRKSPTVDPTVDRHFLDGFPSFSGTSCSAGKNFVRIDPDGRIYRCGKNTQIGDIHKNEINLFLEPRPCDDKACPYMCLRYTGLSVQEAKALPKITETREWNNRSKELIELKNTKHPL